MIYAFQYNTGLHQSLGKSPFEVFFCRIPKTIPGDITVGEFNSLECDSESWNQNGERIRQESATKQEKTNQQMVERHKSKNPVATYDLGDTVIVKRIYAKNKKSKKNLVHKGIIIEKKNKKYKVKFTKDGQNQTEWFTCNQMTAETRAEENQKHGKKKYFKNDYHLNQNLTNHDENQNQNIQNQNQNHECTNKNQKSTKEKSYNLRKHRKRIFVENSDFDLKRALEESRKEVRIRSLSLSFSLSSSNKDH